MNKDFYRWYSFDFNKTISFPTELKVGRQNLIFEKKKDSSMSIEFAQPDFYFTMCQKFPYEETEEERRKMIRIVLEIVQ